VCQADAGRRPVRGYSLGMRQRLALATALLGDPRVLILDEPANGLDPEGIAWLRRLLRDLADQGRTVLVSSHVLSEVQQFVDQVVILHRGRPVRQGTLTELANRQTWVSVRTPQANRLLAALALLALTAPYASLAIAFGDTPDNPTPPLTSPGGQRTLFSVGQGAGTLLAVLAAIGLTGEFRHQTTTTFLATPHRGRVVLAKLITYALVGVGYALACIAVTIAIALPWLDARGIPVPLGGNGIPATLAGSWPRSPSSASSASDWAPWSASRSPPWSDCWSTCSSLSPSSPASRPSTAGPSTCPAPPPTP
jgi:hypothetical protein